MASSGISDIETRLFRYFVALAEEQHFARAALRLGITPPTLTHQIQKLESRLRAKLLERKGNRRVALTEAGTQFFAQAQHVLHEIEKAALIARQAERGEAGRIELGFMTGVSFAGLLQGWIGAFKRANPAIDITIRKLAPVTQIAAMMRKELDAGSPVRRISTRRGFKASRSTANRWSSRSPPSIHWRVARASVPRC